MNDIVDDDLVGSTGYHNALPLEVHGSSYVQMHMLPKNKQSRLVILQRHYTNIPIPEG